MPGLAEGSTLAWQCPDAVSKVETSAAIMRGYPGPMDKMLGVLIRDVPEQARSAVRGEWRVPGVRQPTPKIHITATRPLESAGSADERQPLGWARSAHLKLEPRRMLDQVADAGVGAGSSRDNRHS
jgi:hypothetical protein